MTSKQMKILADAGYVTIAKPTGAGGRAKTCHSDPAGRQAFEGHLLTLQQIAAGLPTRPSAITPP